MLIQPHFRHKDTLFVLIPPPRHRFKHKTKEFVLSIQDKGGVMRRLSATQEYRAGFWRRSREIAGTGHFTTATPKLSLEFERRGNAGTMQYAVVAGMSPEGGGSNADIT